MKNSIEQYINKKRFFKINSIENKFVFLNTVSDIFLKKYKEIVWNFLNENSNTYLDQVREFLKQKQSNKDFFSGHEKDFHIICQKKPDEVAYSMIKSLNIRLYPSLIKNEIEQTWLNLFDRWLNKDQDFYLKYKNSIDNIFHYLIHFIDQDLIKKYKLNSLYKYSYEQNNVWKKESCEIEDSFFLVSPVFLPESLYRKTLSNFIASNVHVYNSNAYYGVAPKCSLEHIEDMNLDLFCSKLYYFIRHFNLEKDDVEFYMNFSFVKNEKDQIIRCLEIYPHYKNEIKEEKINILLENVFNSSYLKKYSNSYKKEIFFINNDFRFDFNLSLIEKSLKRKNINHITIDCHSFSGVLDFKNILTSSYAEKKKKQLTLLEKNDIESSLREKPKKRHSSL